ncbi:MAG: phosphatidate cytidylyltransferase [SAR324 cluster bacterium]|nr:phosphatidate cytidylyltransferase [SAR324 cluster bacterium]
MASTAVLVSVTMAAIWAGGVWLTALLAAAAAVGAFELAGLARGAGLRPVVPAAVVWSVAIMVAVHLYVAGDSLRVTVVPVLAGGAVVALAALAFGRDFTASTRDFLATGGSALAAGGLLSFGLLLRGLEDGSEWSVALVLVIAAADVGGYAVGTTLGRHKLAPAISPAKTWEGAAGGLAAAVGISIAAVAVFDLPVSVGEAAGLGALLWAGGLIGDLVVSAVKRRAGVKDSGHIVPGHGGLFDRLDSIVLNLVLAYYFVLWVAP